MASPAFKEWNVIVEALGAGEQTLILRKGGISEGRGGFKVRADRFWLFPTQFHAQKDKTKPEAAGFLRQNARTEICLKYFAQVESALFLTDWEKVKALDGEHFWTEQAIRDRFDWNSPQGIHALVLRIHRIVTPIVFQPTAEMAGCKSWVELPFGFDTQISEPVLSDAQFAEAKSRLNLS